MDKRANSSRIKGFTLIETLVAIAILTIAIVGPLTLAMKSIISSYSSQNNLTAVYLAQEGLEYVKNVRDNNILQGEDWIEGGDLNNCIYHNINNPKGCYINIDQIFGGNLDDISQCHPVNGCPKIRYNPNDGYNYYEISENNPETIFTRTIKITKIETEPGINDEAQVESKIEWTENGAPKNVILKENIFNWK